jgi:hypothetical protein
MGSLVIAILDFLRLLCSVARQQEGGSGNFVADCALCILGCILSLIQWAAEFINRYAFSYMALYGDAYIASAKQTWRLIKDRGIDALINECLINPVLSLGSTFVGVCSAFFAYLYLAYTNPAYNTNGGFTAVILLYAFLIGTQVCACVIVPLTSGIDTFFVAAAWDPETLMRKHGNLYGRMVEVYPHVSRSNFHMIKGARRKTDRTYRFNKQFTLKWRTFRILRKDPTVSTDIGQSHPTSRKMKQLRPQSLPTEQEPIYQSVREPSRRKK